MTKLESLQDYLRTTMNSLLTISTIQKKKTRSEFEKHDLEFRKQLLPVLFEAVKTRMDDYLLSIKEY